MLVNGTLFNSEAWHSLTKKDVVLLERVDESLLRGVLQAHPKMPLEALYLKTKAVPIRYILASRIIMYLYTILQRDPSEMLRKIFKEQKRNTSQGDFVELVEEDLDSIELNMTERMIQRMPKQKFKKIVKTKVLDASFKYLKGMKQTHSKLQYLKYDRFEMSEYLKSPKFNTVDISLLLALRTRTVRGVRNDLS